ncbi:MAG: hypothetical protein AAFV53_02475 [Myxococcota bacterium]
MSSPEHLAATLTTLPAGARIWFWICAEAKETPLLITRVSDDPDMAKLRDLSLAVTRSPLSAQVAGLGHCNEDGTIDLLAEGLDKTHLKVISRFVKNHLDDHPGLARIRGMRLLVLAEDGQQVEDVLHHPPLWEGVPTVAAPQTAAATVRVLEDSAPGAQLRLWMTLTGPGGAPFVTHTDINADPDGKILNAQIRAALRRGAKGRGQRAIYTHRAEGRTLFAAAPIDETLAALQQAWPALPPMTIEVTDV